MNDKNYRRNRGTRIFAFTVLATLLGGTAYAAEEYNINPGMWETTYKSKATGLPAEAAAMMGLGTKVEKNCVKDKTYVVDDETQEKGCTLNSKRHSDKKLSWDRKCSGNTGSTSEHGEINFNGNTVSGTIEMKMKGPNGPASIHTTFEAKRIGPC
jgi:hypothetical protein